MCMLMRRGADPREWKKRWEGMIRERKASFARVYGPHSIIINKKSKVISSLILLYLTKSKTYC